MARDRQRGKRRRQRPEDAPDASSAARDAGLDDATVADSGLGGTPAPDPLKNAMPDVDQARLAETGVGRGPSGEAEDAEEADPGAGIEYAPAPDEVEERALEPRSRRDLDPSVAEEVVDRPARKQRGRVLAFFGHCVDELRRVQWPDRRQVGQATAVVLGFVVLAGGYLGLMDAIFKPLVQAIL